MTVSTGRRPDPATVRAAFGLGTAPRTVVATGCAVGVVGAGLLVALRELPVWPYILLVGWLCVSAVARRTGWAWAVVTVGVVGTTSLYGASVASAEMSLHFHATMAFVVGLADLLALRALLMHGGARAPHVSVLWIGVAPLVWLGAAAIGAVVSGGSRWDWAIGGRLSQ